MRSLLFRSSILGVLLLPAGLPAQDPQPARNVVVYSGEELDNLVAPVALYPDALLAQILVASTFPEQIAVAARHVRERGNRDIDNQGWDISVKAVAYYPPILNMLANQEDWANALGQAYAAQSADVMDSVQRLREMASQQGNLVSTPEHTVTNDRDRIVIVPANPQVIYVPTYDPAVVYVRPVYGLRFHGGYFSFGIGFPIGSWLVYDMDWWGRRVYYDGWSDYGWRRYARRHIHFTPVYVHPRHRIIHINVNIFSRRVDYGNLDRRYRYVRQSVRFDRDGRGRDWGNRRGDDDRNVNRDGRRDGDGRGPIEVMRDRYDRDRDGRIDDNRRGPGDAARPADRGRGDGNDRIGTRTAEFDDFRPDRGGNNADARDREPVETRSGFGVAERPRETQPTRGRSESNSNGRAQSGELRGSSRPNAPVFTAPPKPVERKSTPNGRAQPSSEIRGGRPNAPVIQSQPRAVERKSSPAQPQLRPEVRGSRQSAPVFQAQPRSVERKASGGGQASRSSERVAPSRPARSSPSASSAGAQRRSSGSVRQSAGGGGKGRKQ